MANIFVGFETFYKAIEIKFNEAPPIGAQSGSRIYQSPKNLVNPNLLESKFPMGGGGGVLVETNLQLLLLSPNLLKSKVPIWGGGVRGSQFATFDAESKFAQIQNSHFWRGRGWNQFATFDAESKFAKKKIVFAKNFLSFWAKMCLGMVLDFEYQVVRVYANHKYTICYYLQL